MAESPAHQFGQIVGDLLEAALFPILQEFAAQHGLFLDRKGLRGCRSGKKCTWVDSNGNSHDLDFVLERGGAHGVIGTPVAFIETAWRRYTKHSRNKVQEIQGAIEPLAEKYRHCHPFKGAVLAGVFTSGALTQLQSLGYSVLYVPYEQITEVFSRFGVDATFDEKTSDREFQRKVAALRRLSISKRGKLAEQLIPRLGVQTREFVHSLTATICRTIERIIVLALHGRAHEAHSVDVAIEFLSAYTGDDSALPIARFEVEVRYSNGDTIRGSFGDRSGAIEFLRNCGPVA